MINLTELEKHSEVEQETDEIQVFLDKIYETDLRKLLKKCYQCARCSGVCQISKVQKFTPSRIIQMILEGFEDEILDSGVLWDCLTCNSCLQDCPKNINFADIVRILRYKMRNKGIHNLDRIIAHKGIYPTMGELMSQDHIRINRSLDWIPKGCKISDKGDILYYVGCLPFFDYDFQNLKHISSSTLKIICKIENEPIVVLREETCCGHDLYWGQGKFEVFIELAKKNREKFENAGISTIITACAECYRTFKVDYAKLFNDFNERFDVQHLIEYVYNKWKQGKIDFKKPNEKYKKTTFTFHDPCRLSRFLPAENTLVKNLREIFNYLQDLGYDFREMKHNQENSLCCGVNSWLNCNERSKALRYTRILEAKEVATQLFTSCPKCNVHLNCIKKDYEDISSVEISDLSEFLVDIIQIIKS
ncbi:MAG: (Fe-S)-binding protein [Promethearchaeota archaeon]